VFPAPPGSIGAPPRQSFIIIGSLARASKRRNTLLFDPRSEMYRGQGSQVEGDRRAVGVRQSRGVPDDLGHGAADEVKIGSLSVSEQVLDILRAPFTDTGFRICGDDGN